MVPEVRAWLHELRRTDRSTALLVGQAISMLLEAGPELGRPFADRIHGAALPNLKELRPGSAGRSEVRILFVFDPRRRVLLVAARCCVVGRRRRSGAVECLVSRRRAAGGGSLRRVSEGARR